MPQENPITLFTGQWADLPLEEMAAFAKDAGYDGLELACWGNHYNVQKALDKKEGDAYIDSVLDTAHKHGLGIWSFGGHLVGQAVAAKFANDSDLLGILPTHVRSNDAEQVRLNAAAELADTARAVEKFRARAVEKFGPEIAEQKYSADVVTGFTGSPIWHKLYLFPPTPRSEIDKGFEEVAYRMARVLDVFRDTGNKFALEVHPTEIAFDTVTAHKILDTVNRTEFGVNNDASHLGYQGVNYISYIKQMAKRGALHHSHIKDVTWGLGASNNGQDVILEDGGDSGVFGGHLQFGDDLRGWDFRSIGRGRINNQKVVDTLKEVGYKGPRSVEWEDALLKREAGARASQLVLRGQMYNQPELVDKGLAMYADKTNYARAAFDAAFSKE